MAELQKNDVNVHEYDSVGKDIIVRMIGQPVFSSFKRKYKTNTLGNASAVKVAPDRTIDYSLRFHEFLAVSRTIQSFERLTNLNSSKPSLPTVIRDHHCVNLPVNLVCIRFFIIKSVFVNTLFATCKFILKEACCQWAKIFVCISMLWESSLKIINNLANGH